MSSTRFPATVQEFEDQVAKAAVYFTTIRKLPKLHPHTRPLDRREFPTLAMAVADAGAEPLVMLYAVAGDERNVLLPRQQWPYFLKLRGELS